jgi:DNA-binding transcriptional ArsR family regulator
MDDIFVDRQTLKALGADSRVAILKSLLERRKTQSELAAELGIKPPSAKEHVERLVEAELVAPAPDGEGRKWKYVELTAKGRAIVEPPQLRGQQNQSKGAQVWLLLGMTAVGIIVAFAVVQTVMGGTVSVAQSLNVLSRPASTNAQATLYAVNPATGKSDTPVSVPANLVALTQSFLREHPGSTMEVRVLDGAAVRAGAADLAEKCGGAVSVAAYYQIQASDGEGNRLFALVRADNPTVQNGGVACLNLRGAKA